MLEEQAEKDKDEEVEESKEDIAMQDAPDELEEEEEDELVADRRSEHYDEDEEEDDVEAHQQGTGLEVAASGEVQARSVRSLFMRRYQSPQAHCRHLPCLEFQITISQQEMTLLQHALGPTVLCCLESLREHIGLSKVVSM